MNGKWLSAYSLVLKADRTGFPECASRPTSFITFHNKVQRSFGFSVTPWIPSLAEIISSGILRSLSLLLAMISRVGRRGQLSNLWTLPLANHS